ncbi:MAG TPA: cupin domain-containing protein [Longimicrobiaceae bacterium]|nr:cupin domain-containing protein [Longimicrobiaceae bacterium]
MLSARFLIYLALAACGQATRPAAEPAGETQPPMDAASGVARADGGRGPREPRMIPLGPMSGDVEILYGDPEAVGQPFVMRIRELPGTVVPPHSHPVDEHITVVQGTWYFGVGETFDSAALRALPAGSYAFAPGGTTMFARSPEAAVVQVHGVGPFHIHWRDGLVTLDDAGADSTFRFRRGDEVATERGRGRIRNGYASGALVQYEIERADGELFMAEQRHVRRP